VLIVNAPDAGREMLVIVTPVVWSSSKTNPVGVGVPEVFATVPVNVVGAPIVEVGGPVKVVVVGVRLGAAHLVSRFATLTEPNPVARS
jgi:hypothetical protein